MEDVGAEIKKNNLIAQSFVMLKDEMEKEEQMAAANGTSVRNIQLLFKKPGQQLDPNTYNLPQTNEVAVVFVPDVDNQPPKTEIVVKSKDGGLQKLYHTNPLIDRLVC